TAGGQKEQQAAQLGGVGTRFEALKVGLTIEGDARAVDECLVRTRSKRVGDGDERAGDRESDRTLAKPAPEHGKDLKRRAENETGAVAEAVGEPPGGDLRQHERDVAGRHDRGHDCRRYVLLLDPPDQVERVHDALYRSDTVGKVKAEVSAVAG